MNIPINPIHVPNYVPKDTLFINEKNGPKSNTSVYVNSRKREELLKSVAKNEENFKKVLDLRPIGSINKLGTDNNLINEIKTKKNNQ